ncbi:hypothetical protein [Ralstonia pseudosolanacearum]|uniref:hypothetical protein n=1 Tax=Ralstonia pseudosolanacearum TaxID=1310165 RepID=UPI000490C9A6|nr:hypothetical protein [Ralstonia pseudosolanacearum]MDO3558178.1 hypothetical protein [Ralstonia pseudosolanacearum]MDO3577735.1 hypothetical protein [Ralstonia pseudosolanacearum]MDO3586812.1 hypothetical protein [Ralstonia pseudosolanacearum]
MALRHRRNRNCVAFASNGEAIDAYAEGTTFGTSSLGWRRGEPMIAVRSTGNVGGSRGGKQYSRKKNALARRAGFASHAAMLQHIMRSYLQAGLSPTGRTLGKPSLLASIGNILRGAA